MHSIIIFEEAIVNFKDDMHFKNGSLTAGIRRMFYLVSPNETSFERVEDVPDYVNEAVPFFLGAISLEFILAWLYGYEKLRLNDGLSSIGAGVMLQLLKMVMLPLELILHNWVYTNYRIADLPWDSAHTWWAGFLAMDFLYYWFHRASHEINIIWSAHQAHHSSEDYNLSTALRQSVIQHLISNFIYASLGFIVPPSIFLVHIQFNLIYQFWIHTELVKSLGPLEYILNTPSHHRVHHGRNSYCIDTNYGGTLIIWDRLFGTFQAETDEKVIYGLRNLITTWDPIQIQIGHYCLIAQRFWTIEGLKNKLFVLIKGPSWIPGKPRLGDPTDRPSKIQYPVRKFDVSLPLWGNIYVLVHIVIFAVAFLELASVYLRLTQTTVFGVVIYMMFTITSFGLLMENRWYVPYMEFLRCAVFVVFDHLLTSSEQSVGFLPLSVLGATRVIYAVSMFLWFLLCTRPEKVFAKED